MDKKQNRSVQAPTKGVGTDLKKNQDVAGGKCWPRGGRKREPTGGSFPSKNEASRKPVPQRNKFLDKRPKSRGNYYCAAESSSGKENTGLAEFDPELGSVFVSGSKKPSLNHLLNFHYTPRGDVWSTGAAVTRSPASGSHRWLSTHKHKYNKEQFLQANCQFVVNSKGDYKLYMNNPDALVDWDLVEQIHVQVSEFPSCPICLCQPVAAKMTRCGHVYCWSCILHYLALSDKTWRKCPICYESVHKNDLKSAIAIPHAAFNVGEYITLRLMKRAQGSLTAIPVDESKMSRNSLLNMSETKVNTVYSKLLLANSSEVMSIIDRERTELTAQLNEDENCPEKCFIEQAISQLQDREKLVIDKISKNSSNYNQNLDIEEKELINETGKEIQNRSRFESVSSEGLGSEDCNLSVLVEEMDNKPSTSDNNDNIKFYYFYQASDGQHIYLHAVNIRMLEYTYGSLEFCPTSLNGKIVEKEGGSMTEELRKRFRYLQHLPLTCQFEMAEVQLKPPVVNKETVDFFQEQLDTRKKRRQRRARDEKRREKRLEAEENRRMGRIPEVNVHIESLNQFPQFGADDSVHIESLNQFPQFGADDSVLGASPPNNNIETTSMTPSSERSPSPSLTSLAGSVPTEEQCSGPSFAKMLATGKKPSFWPSLGSPSHQKSQPLQQPQRLINIKSSQTPYVDKNISVHSDTEPDPEGYVRAPAFNQSFSDCIALALEKANIKGEEMEGEASSSGGGKKKKKNKKKILFATSMVYSGNN